MVKMKLGQLSSPPFLAALTKVMAFEGVPITVQYKLKKVAKRVQAENKRFAELRAKLLEIYCTRGGDREFQLVDNKYVYKNPEMKKTHEDEFEKLCDIEAELPTIDAGEFGEASKLFKAEDLFQLDFIEYIAEEK